MSTIMYGLRTKQVVIHTWAHMRSFADFLKGTFWEYENHHPFYEKKLPIRWIILCCLYMHHRRAHYNLLFSILSKKATGKKSLMILLDLNNSAMKVLGKTTKPPL